MTRYANIIVDVAASDVDKIFDYSIPEDMSIERGMRVKIPFGPPTNRGVCSRYIQIHRSP